MNRLRVLIGILMLGWMSLTGQVITTVPEVPTANQTVSIRFDTSKEPGDLKNYTGQLYAHTGLCFSDGTKWQYVIGTWKNNTTQPALTYIGFNTYNLTLSPDLYTYYGAPTSKTITQIAIVIRNEDGTKQTQDYFIDVFPEGLNINRILPVSSSTLLDLNESIQVKASASNSDTMALYLNNMHVAGSNTSSIEYTFTADTHDEQEVVIWAANDSEEKRDTLYYFAPPEPVQEALPEGITDGINYTSASTAVLSLYAPGKEEVFAVGDFSQWNTREAYFMKNTPDGDRWWIEITDLVPGEEYAFQYYIDRSLSVGDPYSELVLDPYNDSYIDQQTYPGLKPYPDKATDIVGVLFPGRKEYPWETKDFSPPPKENLVIYELLLRDFVETHNWQTLRDTLDYLDNLNINAIELMPFNEFEGNISWGYNPSYYFAPDKYYGTADSLKAFIDACHQRGIAVIMDIVLNHAMGQNTLSKLYFDWNAGTWGQPTEENPWFNVVSPNPVYFWGSDFDHESVQTQYFIDRVNAYWLTEFKVDGFRFDFTKGFTNTYGDGWAYDADRIAILKRMADEIWKVNPEAYIILEHFTENSEEIVLSDYGMMLWGNVNKAYNQATMGYLSESDFSWGISYKNRGWNHPHLVGYMESHDEQRLMFKNLEFGNSSGEYDIKELPTALERMALAAAFFIPVPGPKMIWQFGELGYGVSIDSIGRTDPKPIRWYYFNQPDRLKLYKTFAALIDLKLNEPAFSTTDFQVVASGLCKIIALDHEDMNVRIVGNFDVNEQSCTVNFGQNGTWYDYFSGTSIEIFNSTGQFNLAPGEFHLYTTKKLQTPDLTNSIPSPSTVSNDVTIHPVPAKYSIYIASDNIPDEIILYNLNGQTLFEQSGGNTRLTEIPVEFLPGGVYILRVNFKDAPPVFKKFIKE
jgi:pullulanase/glycogen debranching enzyme